MSIDPTIALIILDCLKNREVQRSSTQSQQLSLSQTISLVDSLSSVKNVLSSDRGCLVKCCVVDPAMVMWLRFTSYYLSRLGLILTVENPTVRYCHIFWASDCTDGGMYTYWSLKLGYFTLTTTWIASPLLTPCELAIPCFLARAIQISLQGIAPCREQNSNGPNLIEESRSVY